MMNFIGMHEYNVMTNFPGDARERLVADEDGFAELTLNDNGIIRDCNEAIERISGYSLEQLLWQHVSVLLPQLAGLELMRGGEINRRLRFLAHIGHCFEMSGMNGENLAVRICLNHVETKGRHFLRITIGQAIEGGKY